MFEQTTLYCHNVKFDDILSITFYAKLTQMPNLNGFKETLPVVVRKQLQRGFGFVSNVQRCS